MPEIEPSDGPPQPTPPLPDPELKRKSISDYIQALLKQRRQPRNQIAAVSGLTNTYIMDLEQGNIINARREKLLALAVALNLRLKDIDELLAVFDRRPLSREDVPHFIAYSKSSKITTAMTPLNSAVPFGQHLAIEGTAGPYTTVNPEPTYTLMAAGYGRFAKQNWESHHPLDEHFIDQFILERRRLFEQNVRQHPVEQYLCHDCLHQYLQRFNNAAELELRRAHVRNVIAALESQPNFQLYLLDVCPTSSFSLKRTGRTVQNPDLLVILFWPQHRLNWLRSGKLTGFTTRQKAMVQYYKEELNAVQETVIEKYRDRGRLIAYLHDLVRA